jgi:hypothetical protein
MPANPHSTTLYQLGKGILYIAEWNGSTPPDVGAFSDVGNCPRFEVEVSEEKLDHYSSRSGVKQKDKTVTLEIGYTVNFDLDEVSIGNLARYLRGTLTGSKINALTALDKEYALKFVSDNPVGENEKWEMWRVRLTPGGPFNLISDEWNVMSFSGEGLADTTNHAISPYFDVSWFTTTTTV